jgi:hypothetical protein
MLFQFMKVVSELAPLRGQDASNALREVLSRLGHQTNQDGLTEADITPLINDTK